MAFHFTVSAAKPAPQRAVALSILSVAAGLACAATLVLASVTIARVLTSSGGAGGDFLSFYAAGDLVRTHHGAVLYDAASQAAAQRAAYGGTLEEATGYPLPVFAAYVFAPLSLLPFGAAFSVWAAINVCIMAALAAALYRFLEGVPSLVRRVFVATFAFSIPAVTNVVFGQVDLLVFAAVFGAYMLLQKRRGFAAGALLAIVVLKPHFLIGIVAILLVQRQWRPLLTLGALGGLLLVAPAALTSPDLLWENLRFVGHYPSASGAQLQVNAAAMSNWRGFVVSITGRDDAWLWVPGQALLALMAFSIGVRCWRQRSHAAQGFALAAMIPLLVSPHVHTQSLVLLFVPVVLAIRCRFDESADVIHDGAATAAWLLALYFALFVLWLGTALGVALLVFLITAVFVFTAFRWPLIEAVPGVQESAEAESRAAA